MITAVSNSVALGRCTYTTSPHSLSSKPTVRWSLSPTTTPSSRNLTMAKGVGMINLELQEVKLRLAKQMPPSVPNLYSRPLCHPKSHIYRSPVENFQKFRVSLKFGTNSYYRAKLFSTLTSVDQMTLLSRQDLEKFRDHRYDVVAIPRQPQPELAGTQPPPGHEHRPVWACWWTCGWAMAGLCEP